MKKFGYTPRGAGLHGIAAAAVRFPAFTAEGGGGMKIGERILVAFSRPPHAPNLDDAAGEPPLDHALDDLLRRFPDLRERIRGRRVLDFGCGAVRQAVALARVGASNGWPPRPGCGWRRAATTA